MHRPLQKLFQGVPATYDLLNRLLTFRLDECWRKAAARACLEERPARVLDLCAGTGDLALHLARQAPSSTSITGLDFSMPMLEIALDKAARRATDTIDWILGDVCRLPFPDESFDSVGIAFAFRNLTFRNPAEKQYLSEILRIIRKGGRFVIVETSQPESPLVRWFFHRYMTTVVSGVGALLSGHRGAYRYLAHSAMHFHDAAQLARLLAAAGFSRVSTQRRLLGAACVHTAIK